MLYDNFYEENECFEQVLFPNRSSEYSNGQKASEIR